MFKHQITSTKFQTLGDFVGNRREDLLQLKGFLTHTFNVLSSRSYCLVLGA